MAPMREDGDDADADEGEDAQSQALESVGSQSRVMEGAWCSRGGSSSGSSGGGSSSASTQALSQWQRSWARRNIDRLESLVKIAIGGEDDVLTESDAGSDDERDGCDEAGHGANDGALFDEVLEWHCCD